MAFKTHKDIYLALIDGVKITKGKSGHYLEMIDGKVEWEDGKTSFEDFADYKDWLIYEEPKPKKKVTLYRLTTQYPNGAIFQSMWCNDKSPGMNNVKVLNIEEKTIEVDDV